MAEGRDDEGPEVDTGTSDLDAAARLRPALLVALTGLAVLAVAAIASELIGHLLALAEAQRELSRLQPPGSQPAIFAAGVRLNVALVLEAALLEPVLGLSIVGVYSLARRGSFVLALTGLIAFNLACVGLIVAGPLLGVGSSPSYRLSHVVVPLIGLPIAEFALWMLFRPGERARYGR